MHGSILSVSSRALLDACARLAIDAGPILEAAGLDSATIQDPDARIPIEQVETLWRKAYELSSDANLALHAVEKLPFGAYRVIDFLASSAPTIGAALAKISEYFPRINGMVRLPYVVGDCHVTFAVEAPLRPATITRPYAEYTLDTQVRHDTDGAVIDARDQTMSPHLSIDREAVSAFCRRHHIARLALFGSVLRDDFRPDSDVDVLVEFLPGHVPGLRFVTIEREFSELLHGQRVDMVTSKFLNARIRESVLNGAEPLYVAA